MTYAVRVVETGGDVEELVRLEVLGNELTCFSVLCPQSIEEGRTYPVEFSLCFFGDPRIAELSDRDSDGIETIGSGFGCLLKGRLSEGRLVVKDMVFNLDEFEEDVWRYEGRRVSIVADRLDVEFLDHHEW